MRKQKPPRRCGFAFAGVLLVLVVLALATCDVHRTLGEGLIPEVRPCDWLK